MIRTVAFLAVAFALSSPGRLDAQPKQGRQFAFLVACGDYDKAQLNSVTFTVPEMTAFRQILIDSGVPDKNIVFLHDKADEPRRFLPVRENILKELSLLMERLRPEDSVIVALSGHGVQFAGEKYGYFCPLNANLAKKDTLLPMEGDNGLLKRIEQGKAGKKLLIVNACRNKPASGATLAAERLQLRDDYNEEAPKGTVMLLACKQGQFSWFYDDKEKRPERRNRSLFMYHLTEAWKGSYAKGKNVTVDHIVEQVTERVEADANPDFGHNQIPIVKRKFEGRWEVASAALPKPITNSIGMKLVFIPPGTFQMGSPKEEKERRDNEFLHEVELTKGFYMGVYTVTQQEYETVMGKNPSWFCADGKGKDQVAGLSTRQFPVEQLSWMEAKEFCRKLSQKEGKTYRLPSEAEWEYACRAGATTPFHFGETISTDQANYYGKVVYGSGKKGVTRGRPMPVGSFAPNAWGLYDMHGNVWHWCEDWYDAKYYNTSPKTNPLNETKGQYRVLRGGSWGGDPGSCRSACRTGGDRSGNVGAFGFRVVFVSP